MAWHQQFLRLHIVRSLEAVQDMIIVSLCVGLFCIMALQLKEIFASLLRNLWATSHRRAPKAAICIV